MSEVKKIATRESYGNALLEVSLCLLQAEHLSRFATLLDIPI